MTQFAVQIRSRVSLPFISEISKVLQTLLKYFNGKAISRFAILALLELSESSDLNLNDLEAVYHHYLIYLYNTAIT